jgi:hypothetical protein
VTSLNIEKDSKRFLILLILADSGFILVHLLHVHTRFFLGPLFSIQRDWGYAEVFQYLKEFWIVVLLIVLAIRRASFLYLAWSLLFLYLLVDDSLRIHERLGGLIVSRFDIHSGFGLRGQDFGELMVSSFFGTLLFLFIAAMHHVSDFSDKRISKSLFIMIALLVLFGVIIDMVDILFQQLMATSVFGIIEDGGEMVVMSAITSFAFRLHSSHEEIPDLSKKTDQPRKSVPVEMSVPS